MGGRLQIVRDENGGEYGVCIFDQAKTAVEEWDFYRNEAQPTREFYNFVMSQLPLEPDSVTPMPPAPPSPFGPLLPPRP
jgi:hypothetical protein